MNRSKEGIKIVKQIDRYLKGKLSEEAAEKLWVELIKNPEYLEFLEVEIGVKSIIESRNPSPGNKWTRSKSKRTWAWATAASIAILIITITLIPIDFGDSPQSPALQKISLLDNLVAPEVLRSSQPALSGTDSLLNLGFKAALAGNFDSALNRYQTIIDLDPNATDAGKAYINIGIIKYNHGEYASAAEAFEKAASRAEEESVLQEQAFWYLGNTLLKQNKTASAKDFILRVSAMEGAYKKQADALLNKLPSE